MARPLRIQFEGAWYHVMNRGAAGRVIYPSDVYRQCFVELLSDIHERYGVEVHAWCQMDNHYHLLLCTPRANLDRAMRHLDGVYTQRHNRLSKTDGPLLRGRYKAIVVDSDAYLTQLSRYIHLNPVEARIIDCPEAWTWSSYRAFLGQATVPDFLHVEKTLALFGTRQSRQRYQAFVGLGVDEEIHRFYSRERLSPVLGSRQFIDGLRPLMDGADMAEIPDSKRLRVCPGIEAIIEATADAFDVETHSLRKGGQGHSNLPRAVAMSLCRSPGGHPLKDIAQAFGLRSYAAVAMAIHRVKPNLANTQLSATVTRLKRRLFHPVQS